MTDTPTLRNKVKDLEIEVNSYMGKSTPMLDLASKNIYLYIIAGVLLLLVVFRPTFLYREEIPSHKKVFCMKKLFLYWIMFSAILVIGLYAYNLKFPKT